MSQDMQASGADVRDYSHSPKVEPLNVDTFGTRLKYPDYRGVHNSGV